MNIMLEPTEPNWATLQRIADALGVPVEQFLTGALPVDTEECLRLCSMIKTEEGRRRAVEALRAIVDGEAEQRD